MEVIRRIHEEGPEKHLSQAFNVQLIFMLAGNKDSVNKNKNKDLID